MNNRIKAVIFDMDGVLIDAKEWHFHALNDALKIFGYEISIENHLSSYDGLPTKKKLEMLSIDFGLPKSLHSLISNLKQQNTEEYIYRYCAPKFIHEYALSRLKSEGYLLACASNSIYKTIELMLNRANLLGYFREIVSAENVTQPKPSPDIYLETANRLGVSPSECLVLEDNQNGIYAALEAGANVLVVEDTAEVSYKNIIHKIQALNNMRAI